MSIPGGPTLRYALRRIPAVAAAVAEVGALPPADHRPWPLPARPWIMAQTWNTLLFAHWPVPSQTLRPLVPSSLTLDQFRGQTWVGITPFLLTGLRPRAAPAIPGLSAFPEINVRTYVSTSGKPGVYFFSLDTDSGLAVSAARAFYSLPYFRARFDVAVDAGTMRYATVRTDGTAQFSAIYRPTGEAMTAEAGTLTAWLTERYCLYAEDRRGILYRTEIHHPPWLLRPAIADVGRNTMTIPLGFRLPDVDPLLHFADRLHVHVWAPEKVRSSALVGRRRSRSHAAATAAALATAVLLLRRTRRPN
jgi:uncharacterized protein